MPLLVPRDVRKSLDLMRSSPDRAWSTAELASACAVSPRTLQKHFCRYLGKSPRRVLLELRLDATRRDLVAAGDAGSVTAAASARGFAHLGRFAQRYRERYGESPSSTLRRSRAAAPIAARPVLAAGREQPTIAVLPFERSSAGPPISSAIEEELAAALARTHAVGVAFDSRARYRLSGSVRADERRRVRLTLRLLDAAAGRLVWADHYDGAAENLFAFEERVALTVARAVVPIMREVEIDRARRADPATLDGYGLAMRALPLAMALEPGANAEALELLGRAMELAPGYGLPRALAAWCHAQRAAHHFTRDAAQARAEARDLATSAAALDRGDPLTLTILAGAHTLAHDLDAAEIAIDRALLLDSGFAWAWARSAWIRTYRGDAEGGIERFQLALDLAPGDSMGWLCSIGIASANFALARYDEASRWFARGIAAHPMAVWSDRYLAASLALDGRRDEGKRSLTRLLNAFPDLTIGQVRTGLPLPEAYIDKVSDGLESLGMRP